MPELAEVEFYRKQWSRGLKKKILKVRTNAGVRIFKGTDVDALRKTLEGAKFLSSQTHGKQMLFRFSGDGWLGIHLGMSGELRAQTDGGIARAHDHLILQMAGYSLILNDPRQFGRVLFHHGKKAPSWWSNLPVEVLSPEFTTKRIGEFLARHASAPIKAVLLMQDGFPGIGNWMADEVLWQARIHPARSAGSLSPVEIKNMRSKILFVTRRALRTIGENLRDPPKKWLFRYRWQDGGRCPKDRSDLRREEIGGRTTCWCPVCQKPKVRV